MPWRPILEGEDRARAEAVIADLAVAYRDAGPEPAEEGDWITLARGEPGVPIFHAYLAAATGEEEWADRACERSSRRVVTASGDKEARIWDAGDGRLIGVLTGSPQFLHDAAFDPSGQLVATIGGDGALRFWDASPPHRMLWMAAGHHSFGIDLRFLGEDRLVTRGFDGDLLWWRFPRAPIDLANLDQFLRCRVHKRFDPAKNLVVSATPDCGIAR
jgi:WD40 repeat protein